MEVWSNSSQMNPQNHAGAMYIQFLESSKVPKKRLKTAQRSNLNSMPQVGHGDILERERLVAL